MAVILEEKYRKENGMGKIRTVYGMFCNLDIC